MGCSPGSWTATAVKLVNSTEDDINVFGVDILPCDQIKGANIITCDLFEQNQRIQIWNQLGMKQVDVVLCDVSSPELANDIDLDCILQVKFQMSAIDFVLKVLKPGGSLLIRGLQGEIEPRHQQIVAAMFDKFHVFNSSDQSLWACDQEQYYLGQGFGMTKTFQKYKKFFDKYFSDNLTELVEQDIPPEILTHQQMKESIIRFLWKAHSEKFLVEREFIDQIKSHKEFQNIDFNIFEFNYSNGPIDEDTRAEIFLKNTEGQFSFNSKKFGSYEELQQANRENMLNYDELQKYQKQTNKKDGLLMEGEVLGEQVKIPDRLKQMEIELNKFQPSDLEQKIKNKYGHIPQEVPSQIMNDFGKIYYENEFKDLSVEEIKTRLWDEGKDITQFNENDFQDIENDFQNIKSFEYSRLLQEQLVKRNKDRVDQKKKHRK